MTASPNYQFYGHSTARASTPTREWATPTPEWTHGQWSGRGARPVAPGKCPQLTQDGGRLGGAWQTHHTPIRTSPLNPGVAAVVPLPDLGSDGN